MQISLFDGSQRFKIDKPIRLIELFAGYGSQALALKYLGVPFEHYRLSEWAVKSIQAYKDMHFTDDNTDYSKDMTVAEVKAWLYGKISADYNTPMTEQQINRLPEKQVRTIYNNMQATHNLGSITKITANDLNIVDTNKYCYLMTYSFPCQDLSQAGQRKGMTKDSGTRSGLLWEVERLLGEMTERPQILLMENVPQVVGSTGIKDFAKWIERLEQFGYKNYWQLLNAKDYGIPQNRNRCFMISILGDYYYTFPKSKKLTVRLKDFLNKQVDEKYYLSDKTVGMFIEHSKKQQAQSNGFKFKPTNREGYAKCIQTKAGQRTDDNYIAEPCLGTMDEIKCEQIGMLSGGKWDKMHDQSRRVYGVDELAPAMHTCGGGNLEPKIIELVKYGSYYTWGNNKGEINTQCNRASDVDSYSLTIPACSKTPNIIELIVLDEQNGYLRQDGCVGTLTTEGSSPKHNNRIVETNYRIRKLTEQECFRLMGVEQQDFEKVAKNQSTSSLYHLAGDSIVVNVLMAIFKEML